MKRIKTLQMLMLATVLAMINQKLSAGGTPPTGAQQSAVKPSSLSSSQKAQQQALPFGKRMVSKAGEGLGFESRGNLVKGKGKIDIDGQANSFNVEGKTAKATEKINNGDFGIDMADGSLINAKQKSDRTWLGGARDRLINTANVLTRAKTRQISTRVKKDGKETGQIRVDNMSPDGKTLLGFRIYAKGKKSYQDFNPDGQITAELQPNGTRIENDYEDGKIARRREITPNTLNIGSNKTSVLTTFENGKPKYATIRKGSGLLAKEYTKNFNNPLDLNEYIISDSKGKIIETRKFNTETKLYETRNAQKELTQKAKIDSDGNLEGLEIFSNPGKSQASTLMTMKDGKLQSQVVKDKDGNISSSVEFNEDGNVTVESTVPETWTLSGGLKGTGKNITTTTTIQDNNIFERNVNTAKAETAKANDTETKIPTAALKRGSSINTDPESINIDPESPEVIV